ncbi:MAG: MBL fold metallo-hydrolase [Gaiella sp.]
MPLRKQILFRRGLALSRISLPLHRMMLQPPAADEIEVSLFGRGVGECLVIHAGGGRWMIVDSILAPEVQTPVGLTYLEEIGVSPENVVLVVVTHWDDDHIRGIDEVDQACTNAKFVCSAAMNRRDFNAHVLEQEHANIRQGSGVDEARKIIRRRAASGASPEWAQWNLDLFSDPAPFAFDVWSLSPSPEAVRRGLTMLAYRASGLAPARRSVDVGPNECSVALWVRAGAARILLGGDLAEPGAENRGWSAVLGGTPKRWLEDGPATLFKVSHHGSDDARHEGIWTDLLDGRVVSALTPYRRGLHPPPTDEQRAWIHARTTEAHTTTAKARSTRRRGRPREVERLLRASGRNLQVDRTYGHVRARTSADRVAWSVEYFGDAGRLPQ